MTESGRRTTVKTTQGTGMALLGFVPLFTATATLFCLCGCGTLPNGRPWGQDAIYPFDPGEIPQAAWRAAADLQTWIPLAGAAAVAPFDHRVSGWARSHTPLYGSHNAATDADTTLIAPLQYEWVATALATPSGDTPSDWIYAKAKGMAVEWGSDIATANATSFVKEEVGRERPDGSDNKSMPSSAATRAFNYTTLSNGNLDDIPWLPSVVRVPLETGNILTASAIGWARIEAGAHYPSDVLAGAALGHFVTSFMCRAFMGLPEGAPTLSLSPSKRGGMAHLSFAW